MDNNSNSQQTKLTPELIKTLPPEKAVTLAANMFIGFKKAVGTLAEIQKILPRPEDVDEKLSTLNEKEAKKLLKETVDILYGKIDLS